MEQPLENRIAEAYRKKDNASSFKRKDELWQKIALSSGKKGVATFWRAAAIILALITFGGAFAAINVFEMEKIKRAELELQNRRLEMVIDSMEQVLPEKITEVQIVEKEKIVYRDVIKTIEKNEIVGAERKALKIEIEQLTGLLSRTNIELNKKQANLDLALMELENLKAKQSKTEELKIEDFSLKPERVKDQMQELKTEPSPKMKLQILKVPNENMNYDINSSLLKK